jgi:Survival protein SurE
MVVPHYFVAYLSLLALHFSLLTHYTPHTPSQETSMNILVTNDDGYSAPGLLILKQALEKVGTVVVVAPVDVGCVTVTGRLSPHKDLARSQVVTQDDLTVQSRLISDDQHVQLIVPIDDDIIWIPILFNVK